MFPIIIAIKEKVVANTASLVDWSQVRLPDKGPRVGQMVAVSGIVPNISQQTHPLLHGTYNTNGEKWTISSTLNHCQPYRHEKTKGVKKSSQHYVPARDYGRVLIPSGIQPTQRLVYGYTYTLFTRILFIPPTQVKQHAKSRHTQYKYGQKTVQQNAANISNHDHTPVTRRRGQSRKKSTTVPAPAQLAPATGDTTQHARGGLAHFTYN
uniref:SFRICE_020480 n=1 Tax=Spodoptera frugiperda TaxID=7108 RepID=A0A2H1W4S9_SPOFR